MLIQKFSLRSHLAPKSEEKTEILFSKKTINHIFPRDGCGNISPSSSIFIKAYGDAGPKRHGIYCSLRGRQDWKLRENYQISWAYERNNSFHFTLDQQSS
jgi:hypothetical protein